MNDEMIVVNKAEWLKMVELVQVVNIDRKERLLSAMKTAWKIAEELEGVGDFEEVQPLQVISHSHVNPDIDHGGHA